MAQNFSNDHFYPLHGGVRHYAWGQTAAPGQEPPYIASLLGMDPGTEPWAELWLGAHPSLPSQVDLEDGSSLPLFSAIARQGAAWIGKAAAAACGAEPQLSFLLKVLSCSHPLSIQSHPDAAAAAKLHLAKPELYKDPHDKTEIIIALKPFEALAGFRNPVVIREDLGRVEAFAHLLALWQNGTAATNLRGLCEALFALDAAQLAGMLSGACRELQQGGRKLTGPEALFLRLSQDYLGDRGTLFAFLLNHIALEPGQSLFLPPDTPHAYLQGTGVECMTNSDNVIRAGLTPKTVDVPDLMATVDFNRTGVTLLSPIRRNAGNGRQDCYAVPTPNFQLTFFEDAACAPKAMGDCLGIFLVLRGAARLSSPAGTVIAQQGTAWLRPAALTEARIEAALPHTLVVWAQNHF